jgi:hypothetical protein
MVQMTIKNVENEIRIRDTTLDNNFISPASAASSNEGGSVGESASSASSSSSSTAGSSVMNNCKRSENSALLLDSPGDRAPLETLRLQKIHSLDEAKRTHEDLEFQLMELEAKYESELEDIQNRLIGEQDALLNAFKQRHASLSEYDKQQTEMLMKVKAETETLEHERQQLIEQFKKQRTHLQLIERKLQKMHEQASADGGECAESADHGSKQIESTDDGFKSSSSSSSNNEFDIDEQKRTIEMDTAAVDTVVVNGNQNDNSSNSGGSSKGHSNDSTSNNNSDTQESPSPASSSVSLLSTTASTTPPATTPPLQQSEHQHCTPTSADTINNISSVKANNNSNNSNNNNQNNSNTVTNSNITHLKQQPMSPTSTYTRTPQQMSAHGFSMPANSLTSSVAANAQLPPNRYYAVSSPSNSVTPNRMINNDIYMLNQQQQQQQQQQQHHNQQLNSNNLKINGHQNCTTPPQIQQHLQQIQNQLMSTIAANNLNYQTQHLQQQQQHHTTKSIPQNVNYKKQLSQSFRDILENTLLMNGLSENPAATAAACSIYNNLNANITSGMLTNNNKPSQSLNVNYNNLYNQASVIGSPIRSAMNNSIGSNSSIMGLTPGAQVSAANMASPKFQGAASNKLLSLSTQPLLPLPPHHTNIHATTTSISQNGTPRYVKAALNKSTSSLNNNNNNISHQPSQLSVYKQSGANLATSLNTHIAQQQQHLNNQTSLLNNHSAQQLLILNEANILDTVEPNMNINLNELNSALNDQFGSNIHELEERQQTNQPVINIKQQQLAQVAAAAAAAAAAMQDESQLEAIQQLSPKLVAAAAAVTASQQIPTTPILVNTQLALKFAELEHRLELTKAENHNLIEQQVN